MSQYKPFKSYSGDWFGIPADQYNDDVTAYQAATRILDENIMLHYEEGWTGWRYVENMGNVFDLEAE